MSADRRCQNVGSELANIGFGHSSQTSIEVNTASILGNILLDNASGYNDQLGAASVELKRTHPILIGAVVIGREPEKDPESRSQFP